MPTTRFDYNSLQVGPTELFARWMRCLVRGSLLSEASQLGSWIASSNDVMSSSTSPYPPSSSRCVLEHKLQVSPYLIRPY